MSRTYTIVLWCCLVTAGLADLPTVDPIGSTPAGAPDVAAVAPVGRTAETMVTVDTVAPLGGAAGDIGQLEQLDTIQPISEDSGAIVAVGRANDIDPVLDQAAGIQNPTYADFTPDTALGVSSHDAIKRNKFLAKSEWYPALSKRVPFRGKLQMTDDALGEWAALMDNPVVSAASAGAASSLDYSQMKIICPLHEFESNPRDDAAVQNELLSYKDKGYNTVLFQYSNNSSQEIVNRNIRLMQWASTNFTHIVLGHMVYWGGVPSVEVFDARLNSLLDFTDMVIVGWGSSSDSMRRELKDGSTQVEFYNTYFARTKTLADAKGVPVFGYVYVNQHGTEWDYVFVPDYVEGVAIGNLVSNWGYAKTPKNNMQALLEHHGLSIDKPIILGPFIRYYKPDIEPYMNHYYNNGYGVIRMPSKDKAK